MKYKVEYQLYPDGTHVCVADRKGDFVADCGLVGDKEAEDMAATIVGALNGLDEESSRAYLRNKGYFVQNLWHIDDVKEICKQNYLPILTDKQAIEFFDYVGDDFNAEVGVSWETLYVYLEQFVERNKIK